MGRALVCASLLMTSHVSHADGWPAWIPDSAVVPFAFSTDSLGTTIGIAGVIKGVGQEHAALFGAGLYSAKGSHMGYLSANNYQLGDNWLWGVEAYQAKFVEFDYYLGEQAGNSSDGTFTLADGDEAQYRMSFRYILPWGAAKESGSLAALIPRRQLQGSTPFSSGVSSIELQPFYTSRVLKNSDANQSHESTGIALKLDWDNRDDMRNPTQGSRTRLDFTYANESWGNETDWAKVEFQTSQYWDLGPLGDLFDKQVLAFNFYTADTPTWNHCSSGQQCQRPPEQDAVRLGGIYRLRSFSGGRFHGRSAIAYSGEYRVLPDWQPLDDMPVIGNYDIPWWQWVVFADVGRVADEYNLSTLHNDMQWSAGGAVRFQVEGIVVRAEIARGDEGNLFRIMINQPF
ncbi:hypothetical protein BCU68_14295 [Vibrio sp. 10N.286.49.B3]|nr:hypothetical protein BCU68_14295 [Vibrio sp. 10N.286.49.B3]